MPVASPTRFNSTSSSITGSYRSTLSSSTSLDKPYYRSSGGTYVSSTLRNNYGDRTTEYRSRYSDIDGKRERKTSLVEYGRNSRAPSVTDSESGLSRYRNDRSESRSRDLSTTRSDSGKTTSEPLPRTKRTFVASAALAMSTAELYDKYSPNNYIPLTQRLQQQQNNYGEISRSKSISNDIGRPPSDPSKLRKPRSSAATIIERPERRYKELSPTISYSKRNSMTNGVKDSNGNEVSVSEIRKRFDPKMTVTKLPTNDTRYTKNSVEQYLSQLKDAENGLSYTKKPKDDLVPVHLPYVDKNGTTKYDIGTKYDTKNGTSKYDTANKYDFKVGKYEGTPNGSRNSSSSDLTKEKSLDRNISVTLTAKLPSAAKNLDPNNPIGKILEKSTVIQSENGDFRKSPKKDDLKTPKHTSNFASYIQISQPIASGSTISPKRDINDVSNDKESRKSLSDEIKTLTDEKEPRKKTKINIKYVDSDPDSNVLDNLNDIESPSGTGFENKTFEHENFLKKRIEKNGEIRSKNDEDKERFSKNGEFKERDEEVKSMDTSTESTLSESTEDSSPETPSSRRKILENNYEEYRTELAGGKGGPSGLRRSSERSEIVNERSDKSTHTSGLNGLRNIGNTCFMNSVIQCLSNTRPLLEYLQGDRHTGEINTTLSCMKGALIGAFASVIKELWRSGEKDSVVNTTSLKSQVQRFAPRFMGYSQQDAQEFLRYLLEGLHEDVNRVTVKPKPILTEIDDKLSDTAKAAEAWSRYLRMEESRVGDIFVGQLKSTLRCTHCNHDSVTFDPFWDLSLPIPSRTGNMKLQQCLQHFTKEEELDGDEKPTCSACGVRRKCLKWFMVQKFPQVLVIHLKRFSPTERFRGKLNVLVEFPLSGLDMAPYAAAKGGPAIYNLYAVSNHSGTTYSGHYTAYCKHPYTGEWHEYNDSRVSTIKPRDVVSPEAYVLFYELARS